MKTTLYTLVFLALAQLGLSQIPQAAEVDKIFEAWDNENAPGCALGIFQDGKVLYARGYGQANLEYGIPNSPTSVFRIASTSKQFTAACIVLLSQQNKLSLSDPLSKFYPDFPDYAQNITITHLLNHTSGVRDYLVLSSIAGLEDMDHYDDDQVEQWLENQEELNFEPGSEYTYSNSGYWLLGQIVEKASGKNMREYAEEAIFIPLGMKHTHFHNNHREVVPNRATGYYPDGRGGNMILQTTLEMIGDGGIFTTIEDMKLWDDQFYTHTVLNKDFWDTMTKRGVLNNGEEIDYAAGLGIGSYNGLRTIDHGGAFVGYRAQYLTFPDKNFSVVIFANRGDANPSRMSYQVADIFLSNQYETETTATPEAVKEPTAIEMSEAELNAFCGDYWNEASSYSRRIYLKEGSLYYYRSAFSETKLIPISSNTFLMEGVGNNINVRFDTEGGKPSKLIFIDGGKEVATSDYYKVVEPEKTMLSSLQGEYYSKELDSEITLRYEEGSLLIYLRGNARGPLTYVKDKMFSLGGMFMVFSDSEPGVFRVNAGRVKNLRFEKKG